MQNLHELAEFLMLKDRNHVCILIGYLLYFLRMFNFIRYVSAYHNYLSEEYSKISQSELRKNTLKCSTAQLPGL